MIGVTLLQYLFRRYVAMICWFILGNLAIVYMVDFTEFSRRASSLAGYSMGLGAYMSLLRLPNFLLQTIPFVVLFSSMAVLLVLNRKYELVVARSAGISAWQFLAPLCAASLLIGILMATVVNPISASALAKVQELEFNLGLRGGTAGSQNRPPWLRQRTEEGVTIIGADRFARRGLLLGDAVVIRIDEKGNISERFDAKNAALGDGHWVLKEVVRTTPHAEPVKINEVMVKTNLRPEFVEETMASPESISFFELPKKVEVARTFGLGANAFAMQYQSLLALPLLLVAMTLIAATVSLKFVRFGLSGAVILTGIFAGFLLYVVSVLVKSFGTVGTVSPVAAAWLPVIVAAALGITVLLHKEDG